MTLEQALQQTRAELIDIYPLPSEKTEGQWTARVRLRDGSVSQVYGRGVEGAKYQLLRFLLSNKRGREVILAERPK